MTHAKIKCDLCTFTSASQFHLFLHHENNHIVEQPISPPTTYPCDLCGMMFGHSDDLNAHIQRRHTHFETSPPSSQAQVPPNGQGISLILEEQIDMAQTINSFKESVLAQLAEIKNNQESFKTTLGQLSSAQLQQNLSLNTFQNTQKSIETQVLTASLDSFAQLSNLAPEHSSNFAASSAFTGSSTSVPIPQPNDSATFTSEPTGIFSSVSESCSVPTKPTSGQGSSPATSNDATPKSTLPTTSSTSSSKPNVPNMFPQYQYQQPQPQISSQNQSSLPANVPRHPSKPASSRLPTAQRRKVLFITDSIGSIADIRHLEESTNTLIYREKAFGAQYKADAFKPNHNFCYASMNTSSKRDYKYAVLQGSTTDITNLDTSAGLTGNIEFYKQEVLIASQNMISAARNIILRNPSVEKVLILDRTPRFDPPSTDPSSLKPKLSLYANQMLRGLLENCDVKDSIVICSHSLPENFQQNLYGNPDSHGFDGTHLAGVDGKNHYTRSLCNILQKYLNKDSRELHNHTIPRAIDSTHLTPTLPPTTASFSNSCLAAVLHWIKAFM